MIFSFATLLISFNGLYFEERGVARPDSYGGYGVRAKSKQRSLSLYFLYGKNISHSKVKKRTEIRF